MMPENDEQPQKKSKQIRVASGFCPDCETSFVEVQIGDYPTFEKHGFTREEALELQGKVADLLSGKDSPELGPAPRLNRLFQLLAIHAVAVATPRAEKRPFGKPRFG
jgi:hypothetical protein